MGFEPTIFCVTGRRFKPLSYGSKNFKPLSPDAPVGTPTLRRGYGSKNFKPLSPDAPVGTPTLRRGYGSKVAGVGIEPTTSGL